MPKVQDDLGTSVAAINAAIKVNDGIIEKLTSVNKSLADVRDLLDVTAPAPAA
jgi:hypothetical protein